jgi:hypothetical protein
MKAWWKTGMIVIVFYCLLSCFGCSLTGGPVGRINVYGIRLSENNLAIQSGAPKTVKAVIEPYFATDLGILFMEDDPDNLITLSNQTRLENPWEYAVTVSAAKADTEGDAAIIVMSLDGSKEAVLPVRVIITTYNLTVRNLSGTELDSDTTGDGILTTWKGGIFTEPEPPVILTNKEPGARYDWSTSDTVCFKNSTIAYLTHEDNTAFTGAFTWRAKLKFASTGITGGAAGFFFGVFKDPTVNPAIAYTGGGENVDNRFRVEGIRVQSNGTVRRYFTCNGYSATNPRNETPTGIFALTEDTEYTFEVSWDGVSTYSNTLWDTDGQTSCTWNVQAGNGLQNIHPDLTDPSGDYYPAFYAAGVKLTVTELSITE